MTSVSIFGLGYVGTVTAVCLASQGHKIIGVDLNPLKVQRIQDGMSPIVEKQVQELMDSASRDGLISATRNVSAAILNTDVSFISVGTPSQRNGKLDLTHVRNVCSDIGQALRIKKGFHWVVVRSTVLPGTTEKVVVPALEAASGKKAGRDFFVCFNPEFLREGTAVADFFAPPFTVIGSDDPAKTSPVRELYGSLRAPLYETPIPAAEMIKYSCNAFHAIKVAFANEMGTICNSLGVNPMIVADIFKSDTRLNISPVYLRPGFAFGGSCLPKDLRALTHQVRELDLKLPLLESVLPSNEHHIERAADMILSLGKRKIGVLGLSFKPGTDDLRESPLVLLVKKLIAEGHDVRIWDDNVSLGQMIGSNRQFIDEYIPHIGSLLCSEIADILSHAEVVVLGTSAVPREAVFADLRDEQYLVDVNSLSEPVLKEEIKSPAVSGKL